MIKEWIREMIKPMLDDQYNKGFSAGVNHEKLVKEKANEEREYDLLRRGAEIGREELLRELESQIEEISAEEFDRLSKATPEKIGFVGTMENMRLVGVSE